MGEKSSYDTSEFAFEMQKKTEESNEEREVESVLGLKIGDSIIIKHNGEEFRLEKVIRDEHQLIRLEFISRKDGKVWTESLNLLQQDREAFYKKSNS
jgi:hemin uptake protein HemP